MPHLSKIVDFVQFGTPVIALDLRERPPLNDNTAFRQQRIDQAIALFDTWRGQLARLVLESPLYLTLPCLTLPCLALPCLTLARAKPERGRAFLDADGEIAIDDLVLCTGM